MNQIRCSGNTFYLAGQVRKIRIEDTRRDSNLTSHTVSLTRLLKDSHEHGIRVM